MPDRDGKFKGIIAGVIIAAVIVSGVAIPVIFWGPQPQTPPVVTPSWNLWNSTARPAGTIVFSNGTRDENVTLASIIDNVRNGTYPSYSILQTIGTTQYNLTGVSPLDIFNNLGMWDAYNISFANASTSAVITAKSLVYSTTDLKGKAITDYGVSMSYNYPIIIVVAVNDTYLTNSSYPNAASYGDAWVYNPQIPSSSWIMNLTKVTILDGWSINVTVHSVANGNSLQFVVNRNNATYNATQQSFWYRDFSSSASSYDKQHYDVTFLGQTLYSVMLQTSVAPGGPYNMTVSAPDYSFGSNAAGKTGGRYLNETDIMQGIQSPTQVAPNPNTPTTKVSMSTLGLLPTLVYEETADDGLGVIPQVHPWSTGPLRLIFPGWVKSYYLRFITNIDIYTP